MKVENRIELTSENIGSNEKNFDFQEKLAKIKEGLTPEQRNALQFLEHSSGFIIRDDDVANIIGVFVGLKKIAYVDGNSFISNPQLRHAIATLGLAMDSRKDLYNKDHVNVIVAKNLIDVKEGLDLIRQQEEFLIKRSVFRKLADFFRGDNRPNNQELRELDRQLGKMLGYPETSFEAFF